MEKRERYSRIYMIVLLMVIIGNHNNKVDVFDLNT